MTPYHPGTPEPQSLGTVVNKLTYDCPRTISLIIKYVLALPPRSQHNSPNLGIYSLQNTAGPL